MDFDVCKLRKPDFAVPSQGIVELVIEKFTPLGNADLARSNLAVIQAIIRDEAVIEPSVLKYASPKGRIDVFTTSNSHILKKTRVSVLLCTVNAQYSIGDSWVMYGILLGVLFGVRLNALLGALLGFLLGRERRDKFSGGGYNKTSGPGVYSFAGDHCGYQNGLVSFFQYCRQRFIIYISGE